MTSQSEHDKRHKKELKALKKEVNAMDFPELLLLVQEVTEDRYHFLCGYFGRPDSEGVLHDLKKNVNLREIATVALRLERGIY